MAAQGALRLLLRLEAARLAAARAWPDGIIPDGTPESVQLGLAEVALDNYDGEHRYYRKVERNDVVVTTRYAVPKENLPCDQCGVRSGRHRLTCPRNRRDVA